MDINAQQRHKLKKFITELKQYRANHTEMVTVWVPAGYELVKIIQHLQEEQGTASNIKGTSTRKNVQAALERMIQHLKLYKCTPPNGLAAFSGNVAAREGQQDVRVWSIEPPTAINIRIYRCDKTFVLDVLEDMLEEKSVYGLIVIDRRDADIAFLKGKSIIPLTKTHSHVPGKFKAGGQCIHPDSLIETNSSEPLKQVRVGSRVKSYDFNKKKIIKSRVTDFWEVTKEDLIEITILNQKLLCSKDHLIFTKGGQEKAAEDLSEADELLSLEVDRLVPAKITSIRKITQKTKLIDISVENENFIANSILVHNSAQRFHRIIEDSAKEHYRKVAELAKEQFLGKKELKGIIVGGPGPTKHDFLDMGQLTGELVKKVIGVKDLGYTGEFGLQELVDKSQDLLAQEEIVAEKKIMEQFFTTLAKEQEKVAYGKKQVLHAIQQGAVDTVLLSESLDDETIESFTAEAEKMGGKAVLISIDTREGAQLRELGGIAALLRFAVHT